MRRIEIRNECVTVCECVCMCVYISEFVCV